MLIQALRSALFYFCFIGQTAVLAVVMGLIAMVNGGRRNGVTWALACYWGQSNLFLLRWLVGIRTRIEGAENLPAGGCIIAAKHQADWDIFAILPHTAGNPAFIAKRELIDIPFFGPAARSMGTISVDRKRGSEAMTAMLAEAAAAVGRGARIVIFPEGTRRAPLLPPDYKYGTARLYAGLSVPVVPVALDSGLYWGRNSPVLWPGTARLRFLEPIPPGLDTETFQKRLIAAIETESTAMVLEAVEHGVSRPLDAGFRARLEAARTDADH